MRFLLVLLFVAPFVGACDRPAPPAGEVRADAPLPKAWPRVHTSTLDALRKALDLGPLSEAERLIGQAEGAGDELLLLRARLAASTGRGIEALRLIEEARTRNAEDPSVYATAAEVYASSEGFDSAAREILRGEKQCGPSAELLRARGIVSISRPGGARKGLEELEAARKADPELPFARRALGQAHLLLGKQAAKDEHTAEAFEHAGLSVGFDPTDVDAQRFLSECHAARGEYDAALAILKRLIDEGEPLSSELALMQKRAGVACLVRRDRAAALEHFLRARALGLSDAELATGARLLAEESEQHVGEGIAAYQKQDLAAAGAAFRAALVYDADSIAAQNHLAVVLFKQQAYAEAAGLWTRVLETARREELTLPEPVHLNLAETQRLSGDPVAARKTLEAYLADAPQGRWVKETQQALSALDPPK